MNSHRLNNHHVVHLTFSKPAKRFLDRGIANGHVRGRCLLDDGIWDIGPLQDRTDSRLKAWSLEHIGVECHDQFPPEIDKRKEGDVAIIAWFHPNSSTEYANFLHWVDKHRPKQLFIAHPDGLSGVSDPDHTSILPHLLTAAHARGNVVIQPLVTKWDSLKRENGDFRLFNASGQLQTFSSSYFKDRLVNIVECHWKSTAEVVAEALQALWLDKHGVPGDRFFFHSIEILSVEGTLETRRNNATNRMEVRRMASA
jgi:hypothetical protein